MAQVEKRRGAVVERAMLVAKQRPAYAAAAVLVVGALLGASVFGIAQAQDLGGISIETSSAADEADGSASVDSTETTSGDSSGTDGVASDVSDSDDALDTVVVDVDGAVVSPSVVELPAGSRVADAIEAAGGLTDEADVSGINRAAVLSDGEKIYIPEEGEEVSESTASSSSTSSSSSSSTSSDSGLININTADADELDTLPGVGPAIAQAIIDDREANGAFTSIEDIMRVSGIGEAKYANIKDLICV